MIVIDSAIAKIKRPAADVAAAVVDNEKERVGGCSRGSAPAGIGHQGS
jgi:hypothetical protein